MASSRSTARWLDSVRQDVRYGLRGLRRTPLASGVMIASVALGIGVATAVFTLTDVMLLRPLPYPGAERLVVPYQTVHVRARAAEDTVEWSFARYDVMRRAVRSLEDAGFSTWLEAIIRTPEADVPVRVEAITRSLLTTFNLRPQTGRFFSEDEDDATAPTAVALISDQLWRARYAGDAGIVGATILVNGAPVTVIGVMPRGFMGFTVAADVWMPVRMTARIDPSPRWTERLGSVLGTMIARVRPGVTVAALRRELVAAAPGVNQMVAEQSLGSRGDVGVGVMSLQEARRHPFVKPILQLMGVGVVSLLLIVCANIASILLARGHARRGELGVRLALGASQRRVARQVLTESMLLGALGLPLGVLLGFTSAEALVQLRPTLPQNWVLLRGTDLLSGASLTPNVRVLLFATSIAGLATFLFGSGPALVASRINAARLLTSATDSHATTTTRGREVLVASQVALATLLLVIAGLMSRSLGGLLDADLGFEPDGVTVVAVASMDTSAAARVRRQELMARLEATPGIEAVAMSGCKPFDVACFFTMGVRSVEESDASARAPEIEVHSVSSAYFRAMRIPLIAGRVLAGEDTLARTQRVVLSASAARRLFGSLPPLGRQVVFDAPGAHPLEVVGIVGDVRFKSVEAVSSPAIYFLSGEQPQAPRLNALLFVRATLPTATVASTIRRTIRDASVPVSAGEPRTLRDFVRAATSSTRFVATLLVAFAASAVLLAGLGIYGVVSYIVSQRMREFGVRLVLGADGGDLLLATVRRSVQLVTLGVAAGLVAAAVSARLLRSFLYGIGTFDIPTYLGVVAVITALGLVATVIPARRITHIDPARILRA
jgi:predicted permease